MSLARSTANPGTVRVRVGTISEPPRVRPAAHCFVGSKCNQWAIRDELPQFDEE